MKVEKNCRRFATLLHIDKENHSKKEREWYVDITPRGISISLRTQLYSYISFKIMKLFPNLVSLFSYMMKIKRLPLHTTPNIHNPDYMRDIEGSVLLMLYILSPSFITPKCTPSIFCKNILK